MIFRSVNRGNSIGIRLIGSVDLFPSHGLAGTESFQHSLLLYSTCWGRGAVTSCAFSSDVLMEPGFENVERIFYVGEIRTNILI